jgi:outer membrane receptor protein involved in Fe transport
LLNGKLQLGAGLRYDEFRFDVAESRVLMAGNWQPKASLAYTPSFKLPVTVHLNCGRGISTADARAVVQHPENMRVATTDFLQFGTSHRMRRVSISTDGFLIDRSNEMVYIPDHGSFEFKGPSRAYGFEVKASVELTRHVSLNAGLTKVANAFYRGTTPRIYVDSAPHFTANASLTVAAWRGWSGSARLRAVSHYRLDGLDPSIVASGHTLLDLAVSRRIVRGVEFNLSVDNATNRDYWETQNYFESRLPGQEAIARIHGTPGYPVTFMAGLTFRMKGK